MDSFPQDYVPAVSSGMRRLAIASAASLVAVSIFVALPIMGASSVKKPAANEGPAADHGAIANPTPQVNLTNDVNGSLLSSLPILVSKPNGFSIPAVDQTNPWPSSDNTVAPANPENRAKTASVEWTPTKTPGLVIEGLDKSGGLTIAVNRTAELKTKGAIKRISVGQPGIADIQPFDDNVLLVTAKKAGSTQVIVWDDNNKSQSIDVNVEIPLDQLKELIAKIAPGSNIEMSVANDTIVLRGQAPNLTAAKQIGDVAGAFGKIQNFIEVAGGQTVAVQVQFAEVSRSVTNSLGVNWGFSDGTTVFGAQPGGSGSLGINVDGDGLASLAFPTSAGTADAFGRLVSGRSVFTYFIKALRENNLLRVLQEPTLTTTSGDPASFLAGGQVAVPVPSDNGSIGIEYKEFGVRLVLTPIVLGNGKIRLIMEAESSDLDYANGTTIQSARVPGLRTRRVQSSVEMGEGQTMSVAGLLDDSVIATRNSIPGLGDIPVLGQLFRSTRYQRKETELVILITPRLSGAMNPDQVTALPGSKWRHPSELEQAFLGDQGGNPEADAARDFAKGSSDRGLKDSDRVPLTTGNTLAVAPAPNDAKQAAVAEAKKAPVEPDAPMFIGSHGFSPVTDPQAGPLPEAASASVKE